MNTPDLVPGSFVGENDKYRVVRLLGEGGMGMVYEAEHTVTHKRVALKWMRPELARTPDVATRFLREAQAAARVRHPNVVDVYDYGRHGEAAYLVMEYLEGETLTQALRRADLPLPTLIGVLLPAMRAVAAAHKQGVIHRDIKPDNIFLSRHDGSIEAKVLDFGISKLTTGGAEALSLTRTGAAMGTPHYMSYEQLVGEKEIDGRTDVYAFGVILYEVVTGRLPFEAETFSALVVKVATSEPPAPAQLRPDLPPALPNVVQWAMAKQRDQRCPSMEALIAALAPFAASDSSVGQARAGAVPAPLHDSQARGPAAVASGLGSTQTQPRSRVPRLLAIAGLLLTLCAAAWFALRPSSPRAATEPPRPPSPPAAQTAPAPAATSAPRAGAEKPLAPGGKAPDSSGASESSGTPQSSTASPQQRTHARRAESKAPPVTTSGSATPQGAQPGPVVEPPAHSSDSAPKPAEPQWYVTPEGRRIMRAPVPGSTAPIDASHAPYTTPSGRVVIPAP